MVSLDLVSHPFKHYEVEVLQLLLAPEFSHEALADLLNSAESPDAEYTKYGFYISIKNPKIGKDRRVYDGPTTLSGRWHKHTAGFIVFLEDDQLTLEVYPWDGETLPADFRDVDVRVVQELPREKI